MKSATPPLLVVIPKPAQAEHPSPVAPRPARWQKVAVVAAGLSAATILAIGNPSNGGIFPACPFNALTGCYCPGCGTLRAVHTLLHGDIPGAMGYNVLTVLSLPFIGLALVTWLWPGTPAWKLRLEAWWSRQRVALPAFVIIVAFAIARNLPWAPFTYLAPHP